MIHSLKELVSRGSDIDSLVAEAYVHDLTGVVKLFLRELPDPLIPCDFYHPFIDAMLIEDYDARLFAIRDLAWSLPQANFHLLRRLTEHLDR